MSKKQNEKIPLIPGPVDVQGFPVPGEAMLALQSERPQFMQILINKLESEDLPREQVIGLAMALQTAITELSDLRKAHNDLLEEAESVAELTESLKAAIDKLDTLDNLIVIQRQRR